MCFTASNCSYWTRMENVIVIHSQELDLIPRCKWIFDFRNNWLHGFLNLKKKKNSNTTLNQNHFLMLPFFVKENIFWSGLWRCNLYTRFSKFRCTITTTIKMKAISLSPTCSLVPFHTCLLPSLPAPISHPSISVPRVSSFRERPLNEVT